MRELKRSRRIARFQRRLHPSLDLLHDLLLVEKLHLRFRGVHIDVHQLRLDLHCQVHPRVRVLGEEVRVDALDAAFQRRIVHQPVVDEQDERHLLRVVVRLRHHPARGELQPLVPGQRELQQLSRHVGAVQRLDGVQFRGPRRGVHRGLRVALAPAGEADAAVVHRVLRDHRGDAEELVVGVFQRVAPRGGVEKQVLDGDLRPDEPRAGDWRRGFSLHQGHQAAVEVAGFVGARLGRGFGEDGEVGDVADARERLSAEAKGGDGLEVFKRGDFGGREALADDLQVLHADAVAVVLDLQQLEAPFLRSDLDAGGTSVQAVLQQLFHGVGRANDDLPGCNPVHNGLIKLTNDRQIISII